MTGTSLLSSRSPRASWWSRRSLAFQIVAAVGVATTVTIASLTIVFNVQSRQSSVDSVRREMLASMTALEQSLEVVFDSAMARGNSMMPAYIDALGGLPFPDGSTIATGEAGEVPRLVNAFGQTLNGSTETQARMKALSGADTAIFGRGRDGWVRLSTLLKDEQGNLRIGSKVGPDDVVARTLDAGVDHTALVQRNGRWYAMSIKSLKEDGKVYGGLSARVDVHDEISKLLGVMTDMKVAEHGVIGTVSRLPDGGWQYVGGPRAGQKAPDGVSDVINRLHQTNTPFMVGDLGADRGRHFVSWMPVPGFDWLIYSSGPEDKFMEKARNVMWMQIGLLAAGLATILAIAGYFARRTLRPIRTVVDTLGKVGEGDLTSDIPQVPENSSNEVHKLLASLRNTQMELAETVSAVRMGVEQINIGSTEIMAGNTDLSSRTEQQAASLEETAASMDELASTVRTTADNARNANDLASNASARAAESGEAVGRVVQTMNEITRSSSRIAEIVGVIDSIAFQTNILALNAAVEAARAGEQGRGFAVVASEVRALAQRSATAAKEIKSLIDESIQQVSAGAEQVGATQATIDEMVDSVSNVTMLMSEISNATQQQSAGIEQVNQAVTQMDSVTQQNAALVEQAAAAAGSLEQQARNLARAVAVFKVGAA